MQIRSMTIKDCEQVAELEAVSFSMPWSLSAFTDTVERENYRYFVAEEAGEIVGYCGFNFVLDEGEIPNVCVKENVRGQGIGKRMLEALIAEAKQMQLSVLYLEVRESNQPARRLYLGLGFEEDGIRKNFYELPREDAVLMSRRL